MLQTNLLTLVRLVQIFICHVNLQTIAFLIQSIVVVRGR